MGQLLVRHIFRISLVFLSAVCSIAVVAKENIAQYSFDIYTQENGLPNNLIQCIYQDSKGWIWVGTSQGLSRFDGYGFRNFLPVSGDSSTLRGTLVRVIKEDSNGNLLVGTENGGLNIFNRKTEKFTHPDLSCGNSTIDDISVNDIEQDASGKIWLGTNQNILVINPEGEVKQLNPQSNIPGFKLEGNFIRVLQFDRNGQLWIGTNNGVFVYNTVTDFLEPFQLPFLPGGNREIWEIYADDEGMLWIGTYGNGLFVADPEYARRYWPELPTYKTWTDVGSCGLS